MACAEPASAQRAGGARFPDFFIVGHAKCGTTALYAMLRCHPQIYMPGVKEPQFFARNRQPLPAGARGRLEQTGRRPQTLSEYLSLFAPARPDQRVGEASTFYLWSPLAPARIAQAQPGAQIVAILREPASFLRSLHLQMVQNRAEPQRQLRKALALEGPRREGRKIPRRAHWPRALLYSDRVRYVEQLRRYHELFGAERVLVLIYDDFRSDNEAALGAVLRFLGVDDAAPPAPLQANPSVAVRSPRLDALEHSLRTRPGPVTGVFRGTVRGLTSPRLRRDLLYPLRRRLLYRAPSAPDEALMSELRRRFAHEVVALSEYLDRDLVRLWGYDTLD